MCHLVMYLITKTARGSTVTLTSRPARSTAHQFFLSQDASSDRCLGSTTRISYARNFALTSGQRRQYLTNKSNVSRLLSPEKSSASIGMCPLKRRQRRRHSPASPSPLQRKY